MDSPRRTGCEGVCVSVTHCSREGAADSPWFGIRILNERGTFGNETSKGEGAKIFFPSSAEEPF